jgi:hypothetical protein
VVSGRNPKGLFEFVEGVLRWKKRVIGYAFTLVTDRYQAFVGDGDELEKTAERTLLVARGDV